MLFNSSIFILAFLPVTLALFFAVGRVSSPNAAATLLGLASLVFYGAWNIQYVPLLLASIGINFAMSPRCNSQWPPHLARRSSTRRELLDLCYHGRVSGRRRGSRAR